MAILRIYFRKYPALMMVFVAFVLAIKALIPTGYMVVQGENGLVMVICPGVDISAKGAQSANMPFATNLHANHINGNIGKSSAVISHDAGKSVPSAHHLQHEMQHDPADAQEKMNGHPCAFTSLSHASLGGVDLPLLALALLFILALGFAEISVPNLPKPGFLRPQLRGPPAAI